MPSQTIQWFPGHMAKTRRLITENLGSVDIVIELLDARIPASSKNPEIDRLTGTKPRLTILTKASLADPEATARWLEASEGRMLAVDTVTGEGVKSIAPTVRTILSDKLKRYAEKGMKGRSVRAMIVGIPNVGKSSLINRLAGKKSAKTGNKPGVTRGKQWINLQDQIQLLDTPGILWPKFDDREVALRLSFAGSIKDEILDREDLTIELIKVLQETYPELLKERYKLESVEGEPLEIMETICEKRGFLMSGKRYDYARAARTIMDEFRGGKLGRISLEFPPERQKK